MGGGISGSQQQQQQQSGSESHVWDVQVPFLQQLYGQGSTLAGAPGPGFDPGANAAWQSALSGQMNPTTGEVISNATRDLGLDFSRNVLPGIRRNAVSSGAAGGTRQGIAEGLAAGEVARNMGNLRATMTNAALDRATQQQTAALGISPSLMSLQASLPWANVDEFAKVLGSPTVLGTSQSSGSGSGYSFGVRGGATGGKGE